MVALHRPGGPAASDGELSMSACVGRVMEANARVRFLVRRSRTTPSQTGRRILRRKP